MFLALKYVTEAEAQLACATMQAEEDAGTASRVLARYAADADAAVRYLVGDPAEERLLPKPVPNYRLMTVRQYHETYYAAWRSKKKPKTWISEQSHWRRLLRSDGLGETQLGAMDSRVFYRWVRDLRAAAPGGVRRGQVKPPVEALPDRPASGAYQRLLRSALQGLLTYAYTEEHLDVHVKLGDLRLSGSTKRVLEQVDPLDIDELVRLMDATPDPKHRAMWAVGAGEGLRPSELIRLDWGDVHWATQLLSLRGDAEGDGKTDLSVDRIPLTPIALRELRAWWAGCKEPATGLVFPADKRGGKGPIAYLNGSAYKGSLATAAKRAKIERKVTPYLLRHSFATIAWSLGIEKDVARRMLRHTDDTMLDRVYTRPRPADLVAKVAKFDVSVVAS